jgi:hypothetical protein
LTMDPWSTAEPCAAMDPDTRSSVDSERPLVPSEGTWLAGCSTHPAEGVGDPISGSGSTWTIPFWISSGPRCTSGFGVSPIPECGLPPPIDSSGTGCAPGSSLGRSALSRSVSASACLLAPCSGENHPTSVPSRCGGRGSSPDPPLDVPEPVEPASGGASTVPASPARTTPGPWPGGLGVPESPWPRSAAVPWAVGPGVPWPRSPRSTWEAACSEGSVTCASLGLCVTSSRRSGRCSVAPTESLPLGVGTAVRPTVASDSPVSGEAPIEGRIDEGLSVSGDGGAKALGRDDGELRPSAAGS